MSKNRKKPEPLPPAFVVVKGRQEPAVYREQAVPEFAGNPLIEALPPLWTLDEVTDLLAYSPHYSEEQRNLPAEVRLHLLENARELFVPQAQHLEIHLSFSNMIRRGYVQRNPVSWESSKERQDRIQDFMKAQSRRATLQSKARGFAVVGPGGMGKSTAVENYLSLYPQVIVHTKYRGEIFLLKQLVWVKIECPRGGSIKSLCINFLLTVDDILGTDYYGRYGAARRTVDELLAAMVRVASWHYLGVLSIDEIQNLSEAKSGGEAQMINFFVQLENTIGVPFNLIGTPDARPILMGRFRQARRVCEQGAINWERMKEVDDEPEEEDECGGQKVLKAHPVWEEFIRAVWKYQYLRTPQPLKGSSSEDSKRNLLDDRLARVLYEESQGITGVAVTLYFLAQRRAIVRGGEERLTVGMFRTVAKENQHTIRPMLDSLRSGLIGGPYAVPDLVESQPEVTQIRLPNGGGRGSSPQDDGAGGAHDNSAGEEPTVSSPSEPGVTVAGQQRTRQDSTHSRSRTRKSQETKKASATIYDDDDLRNLAAQVAEGVPVNEALMRADGVRLPSGGSNKGGGQ